MAQEQKPLQQQKLVFCCYLVKKQRNWSLVWRRLLPSVQNRSRPLRVNAQRKNWKQRKIEKKETKEKLFLLCTYQCKSRGGGGGVRARGGDLMPETIPLSGFWSCEAIPGSGHLTLTSRSLVSIQKRFQIRPSRLSESHAVWERCEVFICFNRHNPVI